MRGLAGLKSMYIPLRQAGRSENQRRGLSDWTKWASLGHYQIVSQTLPLMLIILCAFMLQHIAHFWFGSVPGWSGGCKQCSPLDFHFPSIRGPHFSPPFRTAVLPLQLHSGAPRTWNEEPIGGAEKGLWDAERRIHWQKRPDASLTPTPRSPRMWMNFCE